MSVVEIILAGYVTVAVAFVLFYGITGWWAYRRMPLIVIATLIGLGVLWPATLAIMIYLRELDLFDTFKGGNTP